MKFKTYKILPVIIAFAITVVKTLKSIKDGQVLLEQTFQESTHIMYCNCKNATS